jgi:hypothetical protein
MILRHYCFAIAWLLTACTPARVSNLDDDQLIPKGRTSAVTTDIAPASKPKKAQKSKFYQTGQNTYRLHAGGGPAWEAVMNTLLQNYNLNVVDRQSGLMTTEWDSFFLENQAYRNKVSVRLRPISRRIVELIIHNNTEKLSQQGNGAAMTIWLPGEDVAKESLRILKNIALVLALDPPAMKGVTSKSTTKLFDGSLR